MKRAAYRRHELAAAITAPSQHADAESAEAEFSPGDLINKRYTVRHWRPGGENDVYLCLEWGTWADVAVKIPKPRRDDPSGDRQWQIFHDEVQNWVDLPQHPNVVRCFYAGVRERRWFLVLEWVGAPAVGTDLHDLLPDLESMDPGRRAKTIISLGRDICDGLAHIHDNGIIHGDLKPSNILIGKNGRAKITDLGRGSRQTEARTPRRTRNASASPTVTTPQYMAPELWEGSAPTVQTDIYALGCLLYELAAGERPFDAGNPEDHAAQRRLHQKPPSSGPDTPEPLRQLIADCLHKNPARRPASASLVAGRIAAMLPSEPEGEVPAATEAEPDRQDRRQSLPELRSHGRVSLLSATGRTADAVEQMNIVIRDQMDGLLIQGGKYASDQPSSSLAWAFNDRGALIGITDDWIRSTSDFITAIRLDPRLATAYANLGWNWQRLNCPTLAIIAFNCAIELDPQDHRLYLLRARLLSQQGWNISAHGDYQRAVTIAPDDPAACYGMADSLAALGRTDELAQYRSKGLGHSPDDTLEYLRPASAGRHDEVLSKTLTAHFKGDEGDHEAAIAAYTAALEIEPWNADILHWRGESRLAAGDAPGAVEDLAAFLEQASTTHPRAESARDALRQARVAAGQSGDPAEDDVYPLARPASYIASRTHGQPHTLPLVNLLPLRPEQRLTLLDMLYSGESDRKQHAGRLLWNAYSEYYWHRMTRYEKLSRSLIGEATREHSSQFAAAQVAAEIAVMNGFGVPVMLAEVQLSPNPLHDLRFSHSPTPSLSWASSGAIGMWSVIPGVQTDHMIFDEQPRQAPVFSADDSCCLVVAEQEFGVRRHDGDHRTEWWSTEEGSALAASFCDTGILAVGLSTGVVAFLDPDETGDAGYVRLGEDDIDDMRLWQSAEGEVTAFTGTGLYQIRSPRHRTGQSVCQIEVPGQEESARLLGADGPRILWALSRDELLITRLGQPGSEVKITAPDSTDEGFTAAAVSSDGTVVAAICGSFLHVWRASEGEADYGYLPMTPRPFGRCIAVSADGHYIAVGTAAGSVLIYATLIAEEA